MRGVLVVVVCLALLVAAASAYAAPSTTSPTPRAVAEAMQGCFDDPFTIVGPSDPAEGGAVIVNTSGGSFAIREYSVVRARNAAAVFVTRNPNFALLYVSFPERLGNGRLDTDVSDDFQRRVVDCFYGKYLGQDLIPYP
jgi:hypothetical protein